MQFLPSFEFWSEGFLNIILSFEISLGEMDWWSPEEKYDKSNKDAACANKQKGSVNFQDL